MRSISGEEGEREGEGFDADLSRSEATPAESSMARRLPAGASRYYWKKGETD